MIIALAKTDMTGLRDTGKLEKRDGNWFPKMEACPKAHACIWLNDSTADDVLKAKEFAAREGYKVFTYPITENEPLEKSRKAVLAGI